MDKMPISTDFTVLSFSIQKDLDSSDKQNDEIELKPSKTYKARFILRVQNHSLHLQRINLIGYKNEEIIAFSPLLISPDVSLESAKALYFTIKFKVRPTNQKDINLILSYQDDNSDMTNSTSAFENIIFFTNVLIKQGQTNNE